MDDRITALEQKVAALGSAVERNEIGRFALRHVLAAVCAPLIATTGLVGAGMSPDRVRLAGEMMSSNVLYQTIDGADPADSDRWTALLAEELDKVMGSLTDHMLALTRDEPEIRNRYDALAKAVSDAGGHYSETQAKKFSDTLRVEASSAAIAECEGLLNLCEHERSQADPSTKAALDRMAGYVRARLIALRIGQASSSEG